MPAGMIFWRSGGPPGKVGVAYHLTRGKLRRVRRRESRYLLRTNLSGKDPVQLWKFYILVEIEATFQGPQGRSRIATNLSPASLVSVHKR